RDNLCRAQRVLDQKRRILIPVDDIDLLAAQLVYDRIDARSVHADAGAHRIHVRIVGPNGNLCSGACLSGNALDLHDSVLNFCYLGLKQTRYQLRMCTGYENLRSLRGVLNFQHIDLDALCGTENFTLYLLVLIQDAVHFSKVDADISSQVALYNTCYYLALFSEVLVIENLALLLADLLENDILGIARS